MFTKKPNLSDAIVLSIFDCFHDAKHATCKNAFFKINVTLVKMKLSTNFSTDFLKFKS